MPEDHREYQIIRYANRLEITNPGYSLVAEERLGEPGSYPRNPHIAAIFHELHFAETKGSGIRTMMALMDKANLTPPAVFSDRVSNSFSMQLLFHHLLGEEDLVWLKGFKDFELTDEQKKALIFVRETGAINNAIFRMITKQDTLMASKQLQEMVKSGLLESKAKGPATYYEPGKAFLPKSGALKSPIDPNRPQLGNVPEELVLKIQALGGKPKIQETMASAFSA